MIAPWRRRTTRRSPLAPAVTRADRSAFDDDDVPVAEVAAVHAGTATLADLLCPDALDLSGEDYLRLDGCYARTLILTGYPPTVVLTWLDPLLTANETLDVSLHLAPLNASAAQKALSTTMVKLQSARLASARTGQLEDAAGKVAYEHCAALRERLQRGEERVLSACLYITVYGSSRADLEARTVRVEEILGAAMASTRRATWEALAGLHSTLPVCTNALYSRRAARTLDTSTLATMFPFSSATLQMEGGVLYGTDVDTNQLVIVDAFSPTLFNYNQTVVATSGAGKSYAIKLITQRTLPQGVQTLIVDPTGEYARLAHALGGQVIDLSAGSPHRINPLDLPRPRPGVERESGAEDDGADAAPGVEVEVEEDGDTEGGEPLAHNTLKNHMATVHGLLDILLAGAGAALSAREKGALDEALLRCYGMAGITADPATHSRPAPTLADLRAVLRDEGEGHGLAERLGLYCAEGSLGGLFSGATTVRGDGRLVVFDLHRLEGDLWPAAMYLTGQFIWDVAAGDGGARLRPRRVIVDEAHLLTAHDAGGTLLSDVARRGRKHFLGLTCISQDVRDFLHTKAGQALLTNSSMRLLLRQDDSTLEALDESLRLSPKEHAYLASCPRGDALLVVQGLRLKLRITASPQEHASCTTDPHDAALRAPRRRRAVA